MVTINRCGCFSICCADANAVPTGCGSSAASRAACSCLDCCALALLLSALLSLLSFVCSALTLPSASFTPANCFAVLAARFLALSIALNSCRVMVPVRNFVCASVAFVFAASASCRSLLASACSCCRIICASATCCCSCCVVANVLISSRRFFILRD